MPTALSAATISSSLCRLVSVMVTGSEGRTAGRLATEHLLGLGHPTVWHVAGPSAWYAADDRLAGWREALEVHGASRPRVLLGDWMPASGYAAGRVLAGTDARSRATDVLRVVHVA